MTEHYMEHAALDGSICVREKPGAVWVVISAGTGATMDDCGAAEFAKQQNGPWSKAWVRKSVARSERYKRYGKQ